MIKQSRTGEKGKGSVLHQENTSKGTNASNTKGGQESQERKQTKSKNPYAQTPILINTLIHQLIKNSINSNLIHH